MFGFTRRKSDRFVFKKFVRVMSKGDVSFGYCLGRPAMVASRDRLGDVLKPIEEVDEFFRNVLPTSYGAGSSRKFSAFEQGRLSLCEDLVTVRLMLATGPTMKNSIRIAHVIAEDDTVSPADGFRSSVRCAATREMAGVSMDAHDWREFGFLLMHVERFVCGYLGLFDERDLNEAGKQQIDFGYQLRALKLEDPGTSNKRTAFDQSQA
ncbi:hypothetical protein [Teichococcus aestuarii]|uniref:Uncharacterized protein n=1 Tax=Teichococcus aestuarii TaxID=568898 RepID=A0A2U1UXV9_9PROT|nr:hypothetical protein [Pseudoroseomonas aestuarii]PWC26492.1 hypothetical protein CR165_22860 [Pseudoroseomonas aestuarii]